MAEGAGSSTIEVLTIQHVPLDQRHGRASDLFTIWFGSNIQPLTVVTGALAPVAFGLPLWWSIVALVIGNLGGALFMALHSAQGPKLGVPQMIQSRGQFGSIGSVLVVLVAIVMYVGFFASNLYISGEALNSLTDSISIHAGMVVSAIISFLIVIAGYTLIHKLNRVATVVLGIAMIVGIVQLLSGTLPADLTSRGSVGFGAFLGVVSLGALWQIAYAPYVSDYSRYMPETIASVKQTFWASYWGCSLGSIIPMIWGVLIGLIYSGKGDAVIGANAIGGKLSAALMIAFFIGLSNGNTLNLYGAALCVITTVQTFAAGFLPRASVRILVSIVLCAVSIGLAVSFSDFVASYLNFVFLLLYLLVPWTAINLVDFYLIRHGSYDIESFFRADGGVYGRANVVALASYVIGVLVQLPFMSTADYKGFAVASLDGADIAWLVGLFVTGPIYMLLSRAVGGSRATA